MNKQVKENNIHPFSATILVWHQQIDRQLPWKEDSNPYKIWLSEIIMQQTRVAQGTPYYLKFVESFPTIVDLANAAEDDVLRLWQGLGYYSRARNLHHTAKVVRDEYDGVFPTSYDEVLALKGVGKYTAAAIMSFAYDASYPVVDGNVIRVLSRYFGISDPVDKGSTIKDIYLLAEELILYSVPSDYNQAIMDFGAMQCVPKNPNCEICPLQDGCSAYASNRVAELPIKSKKIKKRNRYFHYLILQNGENYTILKKRTEKDIWQNLYNFPLIEKNEKEILGADLMMEHLTVNFDVAAPVLQSQITLPKHVLSHQNIFIACYKIKVDKIESIPSDCIQIPLEDLTRYAFPIVLAKNFDKLFPEIES